MSRLASPTTMRHVSAKRGTLWAHNLLAEQRKHLFFPTTLCGVLVFDSVSRVASRRLLLPPPLVRHTPSLSHPTLSHTIFHTPSVTYVTYHLVTYHRVAPVFAALHPPASDPPHLHLVSHTPSLSHTNGSLPSRRLLLQPPPHTSILSVIHHLCHIQLCHIPSFTHFAVVLRGRRGILVTSTLVSRGRRGTISHPRSFCVAGVAGVELGDIHPGFTWQAWRNLTSTVILRGRRGSHGTGWRAWARLVARDAAAHCVAGVALGDIHLGFTWQAWHNLTSTVVLRSRRGTHGIGWRAWARFGRA